VDVTFHYQKHSLSNNGTHFPYNGWAEFQGFLVNFVRYMDLAIIHKRI
jgi:hypothetical protein